jgi:hypothetical protein
VQQIIVYLDDAAYAHQQLASLTVAEPPHPGRQVATHWVLVACAPRMTQHVSKWVSHSARENWRAKWADKAFGQIVPQLQARGDQVTCVLAKGPLPALTRKLAAQHGGAQVLDARRPRPGQSLPRLTDDPPMGERRWQVPGALTGIGALLVLGAE